MQATSGPKLLVLFQDALTMMSKNFWSTRQKHILRALQHPKMPSRSTDASADRSNLSKDPSLWDFNAFHIWSLAFSPICLSPTSTFIAANFMLKQNANFYDATYTSFFCEDLQVVLGSVRDQQFLKCLSNGKKWRYNCRDSIAHVGCGECGHSVFL
jgi:hypothetical protein